jgi:hypothetical protein
VGFDPPESIAVLRGTAWDLVGLVRRRSSAPRKPRQPANSRTPVSM